MQCLIIFKIYISYFVLPLCWGQLRPLKNINSKLLQTMKSYMNHKANPCQDFYQYACGNWENLQPPSADYLDTIGSLEYKINHKLKDILEQRMLKFQNEDNEIYYKVREYYKSCKEQKKFDALQYLSIIKPTHEQEWPLANEIWQATESWNIWLTLGRLQTMGFNGFFISLEMKNRNATYLQVQVDKMRLVGLTSYEQSLLDEMDNASDVKTRLIAQNVQVFLKKLAVLHRNYNQTYAVEMSFEELKRRALNVDFTSYFAAIWGEEMLPRLPLSVANLPYFRKLGELVLKTSRETLIHALKLKFVGYLEKQMPLTSSPVNCIQHMRDLKPLALDYIYEQEVFQHDRNATELVIRRLFKNMQLKFASIITEHAEELSEEEMLFLKNKIYRMKLNIGNMPLAADEQFYNDHFASWQAYKGFFYWNHLNALQHQSIEKFRMLNLEWSSPVHSYFYWPYGSPAYQPSTNLLIIPHTYLQYPLFEKGFHEIFLYAELGNTLGHEILHAFDTNGLQYDSEGNPSALFITALPRKETFMTSLECLNRHASSSLNEKIADLSGFRLAYDTYFHKAVVSQFNGGTHLTDKQLFFIKFAQFFCAVNPKRIHYDDTHDTPFVRVPQVVANHAEFEEVFGCQPDIRDQAKCNMW